MKLYKTPLFLLLFCLLTLTLLSGCSSDPQAAGQSIDSPEASSPEQSVEEVQPEEDPAQAEVLDPETNDEGGEGAVPTVPQPPSTSTVQTDEPVQPGNRPRRSRKHPAGLRSRRNRRLEIRQWTIPGVRRRSLR